MDIKLVLSDIDDTLLPLGGVFPLELRPMVEKLRAGGVGFSFATGRPMETIAPYAEGLGLDAPIVSCNGAVVYQGERVVARHTLPASVVRQVMERATQEDLTVLYCVNGAEYCLSETEQVRQRIEKRGRYKPLRAIMPPEWEALPLDKMNIVDDLGRVRLLSQEIDALQGKANVTYYGQTGLEIVAFGITKATGAREAAGALGLRMDQVMAIGDNGNDNELLREAGIGVAVQNAQPSTKRCADYICKGERLEGVLEAIQTFCLNTNSNP